MFPSAVPRCVIQMFHTVAGIEALGLHTSVCVCVCVFHSWQVEQQLGFSFGSSVQEKVLKPDVAADHSLLNGPLPTCAPGQERQRVADKQGIQQHKRRLVFAYRHLAFVDSHV